MTTFNSLHRYGLATRVLLALFATALSAGVHAASLVVTPATGSTGTTIKINASGLTPLATYTLEFAGSPVTNVATLVATARGDIATNRVLPALPTGNGKLRLRTGALGGTVVAVTAFTVKTPLTFSPQATTIHAGQSIRYRVENLSAGSLTILYDGVEAAGPLPVSQGTYNGQWVVPTDRPSNLPANVAVTVINKVGRAVVAQLQTTMAVQPPLLRPFSVSITQPPPTTPRRGQPFNVAGQITLAPNEVAPEQVSLWYTGSNGEVFPLGAAQTTLIGNQLQYSLAGSAPGSLSMTAGMQAAGATSLYTQTTNSLGMSIGLRDPPTQAQFQQLPDDRWRIRVRVRTPGGQPIVGAIVQFDGAPVADESTFVGSLGGYAGQATTQSQLAQLLATDDQGCPLTLGRQITDANGWVDFEFENDDLWAALIPLVQCGNTGCEAHPRALRMAIDASAQGYGFQFTSGPNAFDFLPHIYRVQFFGVNDVEPDEIVFIDDYQDVEVLRGGRDVQFVQTLPPIVPKVGLYDVAIVPWVATSTRSVILNGGQGFSERILSFGPVNSQRGIPPAWVSEVAGQPYPTEITIRTDPAVTGVVSSAKLFLDVNRNGVPELVGNFTPSANALNCTIEGLDKAITWRASIGPLNVKQQAAGIIKGYAEFIGTPNSGQTKQQIRIVVRESDLSWLLDSNKYSQRAAVFGSGGQRMEVRAIEDTPDADIRLNQDPGYSIGRLDNATENTRLIDLAFFRDGSTELSAPVDGAHLGAGRAGAPTMVEPAAGVTYGPDTLTLLDNSFPLFYYVWGVPLLAGIELGASFNILAEITTETRFIVKPTKEPSLTLRTTPSLDLGLNFYLDLDVLFDLVDGGVDLTATFSLQMPVVVTNGVVQSPQPQFNTFLDFFWRFDALCPPFEPVCALVNEGLDGCERLLPTQGGGECEFERAAPQVVQAAGGGTPALIRPTQSAIAYSTTGAGFLAFTRDTSNGTAPAVLVVRPVDGGDFGRSTDETILSTAPGIRSVDIEFYLGNRAVAVWAESADNYASHIARTAVQRISRQRLMYSLFNGETWSTKAALTPVNGGEGGVDLAACPTRDADCPPTGEVLAVWTRDMAGDIRQHRTRVYSSRYEPTRGWTTPMPVDANALLDSAPSAAYVNGVPVVAFVRNAGGVIGDTDSRRVAYRFLGSAGGPVQVPAGLPGAVAWPSIVGYDNGGFSIVHTHADDPLAFVGNTQRVALAHGSACAAGVCAVQAQAVVDSLGRAVYGERPRAILDAEQNLTTVLRGVGFGNSPSGSNRAAHDPIGMALHTGELISFTASPSQGVITPIALSGDGAGHFAPAAAFDPELGQVVAVSTRGVAIPTQTHGKYLATGAEPPPARSKGLLVDPGVVVFGAEQGVDFAIEEITVSTDRLVAGETIAVSARVRNIGAAYTSASPPYRMLLSWDSPYTAGGAYAGFRNISTLAPGEARELPGNLVVPAGFSPDQSHRLYARIFRNSNPVIDVDSSNDVRFRGFGGMPMPFGLNASAIPGTTLVQLSWDPIDDPDQTIAGYRVWHHDGDGEWQHRGSSFELGFVDLGAPPGVQRHYRITSYSANAIESPPSAEAVATAVLGDGLFGNGFE